MFSGAIIFSNSYVHVQVVIEVKVIVGFSIKQAFLQEVTNYNTSWVILDMYYYLSACE